jgi:uncharacterized protein (TIGR00369 family)
MAKDPHFTALESMYLEGPINAFYRPRIDVTDSRAVIEIDVSEKLFHAARAVHGSVCFKLLDDAAFFAANSREREVFVLTSSFTVYFTRPVSSGPLRSVGRVVHEGKSHLIAESVVQDGEGREVARGSGVFVRGKTSLRGLRGYDA